MSPPPRLLLGPNKPWAKLWAAENSPFLILVHQNKKKQNLRLARKQTAVSQNWKSIYHSWEERSFADCQKIVLHNKGVQKTRLAGCIPFRITSSVHKNSLQICILVGHSCSENCKISPFEEEREEEEMQSESRSESRYDRLSVSQFVAVLSSSLGLKSGTCLTLNVILLPS